MKKSIFTVVSCLCLLSNVFAQEPTDKVVMDRLEKLEQENKIQSEVVKSLQKLKVSGYVQTQFQYGEEDASLKVGSANEDKENPFNRIGIRRGRIKFAYDEKLISGVFQLDITEKGVSFKDAFLSIKDPWIGSTSLKTGVFDRPFGYEISYSSSRRESPERSMVFQTLFPDERDLGGMLTLQAPKTSPLNFLRLEAGLFAGNGIKQETDNRKDFIGHLSADKTVSRNIKIGGGVSYYNGGVYQGTENVYEMKGSGFELNSNASNTGKFAKREYIGFDAQLSLTSPLGLTQLRGEYLFGTQPGTESNSKSPNASSLPTNDTYIRNFGGGYAMLVQDLGTSPVSAVVKYDWYDPNTKVSDNEIGLKHTGKGDIAYNTLGLGVLWQANSNICLQAYYELVTNEKTENLSGYSDNLKDNVFTMRLQYKF